MQAVIHLAKGRSLAKAVNDASGTSAFVRVNKIASFATTGLRFFCEDLLQAILQTVYIITEQFNGFVLFSVLTSCSVSLINFLLTVPRSTWHSLFDRLLGR